MDYLGFQTLLINDQNYDQDHLKEIFSFFGDLAVYSYIFLIPFDYTFDSYSALNLKRKALYAKIKRVIPRGYRFKIFFDVLTIPEVSKWHELPLMFTSRNTKTFFMSLPLFPKYTYQSISRDVNYILYAYNKRHFPFFSNLDAFFKTADEDTVLKFIRNNAFGCVMDINYLFSPNNLPNLFRMLKHNTPFIPSITRDIGNYAGVLKYAEDARDFLGTKRYKELCKLASASINRLDF